MPRFPRGTPRFAALVLAASLLGSRAGAPETGTSGFAVDSNEDAVDAKIDGVCATAAGDCTLRAAVMEANAQAGADTITLPIDTIRLSIPPVPDGAGDLATATGDLEITEAVTIQGAGPGRSVVDGGGVDRIFEIWPGTFEVTIRGVTLRNGNSEGGGAILNSAVLRLAHCEITGNTAHNFGGGGVTNWTGGQLTVDDCAITQNSETGPGGSGGGLANAGSAVIRHSLIDGNQANFVGGGIVNDFPGTLLLEDSTVSNNQALVPAAYIYSGGGGIANGGPATIRNATISGNTAVFSGGGGLHNTGFSVFLANVTVSGNSAATTGGGIWNNYAGGYLDVRYSTIAGNTAAGVGGIDGVGAMPPSTTNLIGSIVANNAGGNCAGVVVSVAPHHNLDSGGSCGFAGTGDLSMTDPLLAALADNGGPVATHALTASSPAIDGADPLECLDFGGLPLVSDARGAARPLDGGTGPAVCDIGAYEHFTGVDLIFADGFGI